MQLKLFDVKGKLHTIFGVFKQRLPQNKVLRGIVLALFLSFLIFELLVWVIPVPYNSLFRSTSTLVFDRNEKLLYAFTSDDDMWRIRTSMSQISPALQQFLVAYEDRWFYWHPGVNPVALVRAFRQNVSEHRVVSGGSTLTMQIARIMEPKNRTWWNKSIEVFRALQLCQHFSKRRQLEIYFNIAPYGGNIEGVAAASWLYFGKEPQQLSYGEAALLAVLPNSPSQLRPDLYPKRAKLARDKLLRYVYRHGFLKKNEYQRALAEEVPTGRQTWPTVATHLSYELRARYPGTPRIYSTVDLRLQLLAEDLLAAHVRRLYHEGITNGAVVILDNTGHELLAAVGSADFYNKITQGEVNGFLSPRSPGSALKPFAYALGLDRGLITPQHYLEDVPVDFSGYMPENYDRTNSGIVTAREALERSLNVPAINLLAQLKNDGLYELLRRVNFSTVTPDDHYGLTIVLGGCEVNLLELSVLYSSLACGGEYVYPRLRTDQASRLPLNLFSPGSAYIITDILTGLTRPDLPTCWEFTSLPRVAWKTGTSYGHRDAWSVGYNPKFTIGVWIGNFSGEGRPGLSGAEVAAPLLFDLFNKVDFNTHKYWFDRPIEVAEREVCALSGQLPGPYCKNLVHELYLTNASPDIECQFHQVTMIDPKTGYRLPPHYLSLGTGKVKEQVYTKWPPRVASWFERNGRNVDRLPPLVPEWQNVNPGEAPVIRSPLTNYQYQLREGVALEFQKICLDAAAASDARKLYWFVDGKLFGKVAPGEKLFMVPQLGVHRLVCQDDQGRSSEVQLEVK